MKFKTDRTRAQKAARDNLARAAMKLRAARFTTAASPLAWEPWFPNIMKEAYYAELDYPETTVVLRLKENYAGYRRVVHFYLYAHELGRESKGGILPGISLAAAKRIVTIDILETYMDK